MIASRYAAIKEIIYAAIPMSLSYTFSLGIVALVIFMGHLGNDQERKNYLDASGTAYFLKGYSNREVSAILNISSSAINSYVVNMRRKLKCKSKIELVAKICRTSFINYAEELLTPE